MALKVGELYGLLEMQDTGFFKSLDKVQSEMQNVSKKLSSIGKDLSLKVTTPIVGVGTAAVYTLTQFDDSMSKVSAISGATGDDLQRMENLAKQLGATTAHSASAAAEAMSYLALAGWDTNQILAATPDMLSLASAAAIDLAAAADIVSDTMSMFQMNAEEAGRAADIFAKAQSKSNTNVLQLGEAMKYAGASANAAGMDLEQTTAILGILANNGLKGSIAGTTFNSMLRDMKKSAEDGNISIGDMSIALYDAQGNMRDLGTILGEIELATKGMTTAQRDAALGAVFQVEALKGVNIMLGSGMEAYKELEYQLYNSTGAAKDAANIMEDNLGGALREMKSAIEAAMIALGEGLEPIIKTVAEAITKLALWFSNLSEEQKTTIIIVGSVVAAIGPLLTVLATVISTITTLMPIITAVGGAFAAVGAGPIALIVAVIGALIAIGVKLWQNWDIIKVKASELGTSLKETFQIACGAAERVLSRFSDGVKNIINSIIKAFNGLINGANRIGFDVPDWVPGIGGKSFGLNIPRIPLLDTGGIVQSPTLAALAQNSKPEAVIPLDKLKNMNLGSNKTANIIIELDGYTLASALGQPLVDEIRLRTGLRI